MADIDKPCATNRLFTGTVAGRKMRSGSCSLSQPSLSQFFPTITEGDNPHDYDVEKNTLSACLALAITGLSRFVFLMHDVCSRAPGLKHCDKLYLCSLELKQSVASSTQLQVGLPCWAGLGCYACCVCVSCISGKGECVKLNNL